MRLLSILFSFFILITFNGCVSSDSEILEAGMAEFDDTTLNNVDPIPSFDGLKTLVTNSSGHTVLNWSPAKDNDTSYSQLSYRVYRSEASYDFDFNNPIAILTSNDLSYIDTTVTYTRTYYYIVRAFDPDGNTDGNFNQMSISVYPVLNFSGVESGEASSDKKINLYFSEATGGRGNYLYRVYQNSNFTTPILETIGQDYIAGKKSITIDGLNSGTSYQFSVRVFDGDKEDTNTQVISVSTFPYEVLDFDGIKNLQPKAGLEGTSTLVATWDAATSTSGLTITNYYLYYAETSGEIDFSAPSKIVSGSATSAEINSLNANTEYKVAVRAVSSSGPERNTKTLTAVTSTSAPISFSGASAVILEADLAGFTSAKVFWPQGSGDFNEYRVYVSTSPITSGYNWSSPHSIEYDTLKLSKTITGLTENTHYYIVVKAYNSINSTFDNNVVNREVTTTPSKPTFAGLDSITQPSGVAGLNQLTLSWSAATGAFNSYKVFRKSGGGYNFTSPLFTVSAPTLNFTDSGLTTNTSYCYIVRASYTGVTPHHEETNMVEICATPTYTPPSFAGASSCGTAGVTNTAQSLRVHWSHATGVFDRYDIWKSETPAIDFDSAPSLSVSSSSTNALIANLDPDKTYYFATRARYTFGDGDSSNDVRDTNSNIINCKTDKAFLEFTSITTGEVSYGGMFLMPTKACFVNSTGDVLDQMSGAITISLLSGSGNLTGTLSKSPTSGCVSFNDLNYDGNDNIIFRISAANIDDVDSTSIPILRPGTTPAGACTSENADWITAYGGCYNLTTGMVVSKYVGSINRTQAVWEAPASLVGVDLHDWENDGNNDGRPDQIDSDTTYGMYTSQSAYCHDLVEGGYTDWRLPKAFEFSSLRGYGLNARVSFPSDWFFVATNDVHSNPVYVQIFHFGNGSYNYEGSSTGRNIFCVRSAESDFELASAPRNFTAALDSSSAGATRVNLSWNTPLTGDYDGYYLYAAKNTIGIDLSNDAPVAKIKKSLSNYTVTNLQPNTNYDFILVPVWTRSQTPKKGTATTTISQATRDVTLEFSLFNSDLLKNGGIPIVVDIKDSLSGDLVLDPVSVTLSKIGGNVSFSGNSTESSIDGMAIFDEMTASSYGSGKNIQLRASSGTATPVDSSLVSLNAPFVGACKTHSKSVYPAFGGCYFEDIGIIVSAQTGVINSFHEYAWSDNASGTTSDIYDDEDNNGDGRLDDMDPSSTYVATTTGLCHALTESSFYDWKAVKESIYSSLFALNAKAYLDTPNGLSVMTAKVRNSDARLGFLFNLDNGSFWASTHNEYKPTFCIRKEGSTVTAASAPQSFTASLKSTAEGATQIDLDWNAPATGTFTHYELFLAPSSTGIDINADTPITTIDKNDISYTITGLLPNTSYDVALVPMTTLPSGGELIGAEATDSETTRQVIINFSVTRSETLAGGKIPVIVDVKDSLSNNPVIDPVLVSLTKIGGTLTSISGVTSENTVNGSAIFDGIVASETGAGITVQLRASSGTATPVDSSVFSINTPFAGACVTFSQTIYPAYGGCYFSAPNIVLSSKGTAMHNSFYIWNDNASGTTSDIDDPSHDGNSDGRLDDMMTGSPGGDPGSTGYCHDLNESGHTNWRAISNSTWGTLIGQNASLYTGYTGRVATSYYWSNHIYHYAYCRITDGYCTDENSAARNYGTAFCTRQP